MDNVPKVVVELKKCIASSGLGECWRSNRGIEADMILLKNDLQELNCKRRDIEKKLAEQQTPGETEVTKDVKAWLESAEVIEEEINFLAEKMRKVKCFSRSCCEKVVVKKIQEVKALLEGSKFPDELVTLCPKHEHVSTPSTMFERKVEEIWESLLDHTVTKIGVYGMPGIGKTTALTHIKEYISKKRDTFEIVIWVTVSSDSSITSLQDKIADQLHFSYLHDDDDAEKAFKLCERLVEKKRFVLILDDLWDVYNLSKVGIPNPTPENGCKIVLTTRFLNVCKDMGVKEIEMELHPQIEAIKLFKEKVSCRVRDKLLYDPKLVSIMEQIVQECAGLPLAIVTTARGLKDTTDHDEWEDALDDLRELKRVSEPIKRIIKILKLSFDKLNAGLKKCLLYCALFPEDHEIRVEFLIEHLIVEGIIERKETRQSETRRGHVLIKRLQDACLLNGLINYDGEKCVKMHDLIRDMALQIASESYHFLVKTGAKWESISDEEKWKDDLTKVSLVNILNSALSFRPPNTPRLETLFLYQSYDFNYMSNGFFLHMKGLSVLDLSFTSIMKLPESVSDLVTLTALFLRKCFSLRYVPSLAKLKKLRKLDFYHSGIKLFPEGLDMLVNLRYLNFYGCPLFIMPCRVLRKLTNLQFLALPCSHQGPNCSHQGPKVKAEDLELLTKLETFQGVLYDVNSFNAYVGFIDQEKRLAQYMLQLGSSDSYVNYVSDQDQNRIVYLTGNLLGLSSTTTTTTREFLVLLPKDVDVLVIHHCHGNVSSLCDLTSISDASKLRLCHVQECGGIKHLFSFFFESDLPLLPNLETLNLDGAMDLCGLIKTEREFALPSGSFSCLKELSICNCNNLKTLFAFEVASLPNLEQFTLSNCEQLEAIMSTNQANNIIIVPKLSRLILSKLPKLNNVSMIAISLQEIQIDECPKLRKINPLLDGEQCPASLMHVCIDRDTWSMLKWDCNNAKDFILSLMNLTNDSGKGEEAVALPVTVVSPMNFEEEESAALFRRSLDVVLALFQWDFLNLEEVSTLFQRNFQRRADAVPLFQMDFDELAAALFRRTLEEEEKKEIALFHRDLEVVLVAFFEDGIKVVAFLRRKLHVEFYIKKNLEVSYMLWCNLRQEAWSQRDFAHAVVASALQRRELGSMTILTENSEVVASYSRNLPATPLFQNRAAAAAATLFRMKLNDAMNWLQHNGALSLEYLLFMPHSGYYESGYRQH